MRLLTSGTCPLFTLAQRDSNMTVEEVRQQVEYVCLGRG